MPYEDFPWFKNQTVQTIMNVEEQSPDHFYWPDIDVDLTEEIIEHPEHFPLIKQRAHNKQPKMTSVKKCLRILAGR